MLLQRSTLYSLELVPEKGVHRLIEAYNRLSTDMPIVIIGDDHKDTKYKNELMKLKREKVIFMGYVYGAEYEALLANALLYVSASELEGTSPSLLAAMGARVCTLVNGIDENLQTIKDDNFYAGYYFKHNDVDDLCHVWGKLINNPELIKEMSERGYNLVMRRYRWEQVAEDYIKTFENI